MRYCQMGHHCVGIPKNEALFALSGFYEQRTMFRGNNA